jgi:D-aminopeptidase
MIEAAAGEAVKRASALKPFTFDGPVSAQVVFTDPSYADTVEHVDFVTRVDGRTIRFEAEDFLRAFERFNGLHFLAPVVR